MIVENRHVRKISFEHLHTHTHTKNLYNRSKIFDKIVDSNALANSGGYGISSNTSTGNYRFSLILSFLSFKFRFSLFCFYYHLLQNLAIFY